MTSFPAVRFFLRRSIQGQEPPLIETQIGICHVWKNNRDSLRCKGWNNSFFSWSMSSLTTDLEQICLFVLNMKSDTGPSFPRCCCASPGTPPSWSTLHTTAPHHPNPTCKVSRCCSTPSSCVWLASVCDICNCSQAMPEMTSVLFFILQMVRTSRLVLQTD